MLVDVSQILLSKVKYAELMLWLELLSSAIIFMLAYTCIFDITFYLWSLCRDALKLS